MIDRDEGDTREETGELDTETPEETSADEAESEDAAVLEDDEDGPPAEDTAEPAEPTESVDQPEAADSGETTESVDMPDFMSAMAMPVGSEEGGTLEDGPAEAEADEPVAQADGEESAAETGGEEPAAQLHEAADEAVEPQDDAAADIEMDTSVAPEAEEAPVPATEADHSEPSEEISGEPAPEPEAEDAPMPATETADVADPDLDDGEIIKDPVTGEMVYASTGEPVGGEAAQESGLGLVSEDDALPWLESSEYEEIESVDAWRVTGFVVLGLVVVALLVGGAWYAFNRGNVGDLIADGSLISAPDTPIKERPEDPGGKTFAGTGDMAPAVGEGETREGRLAQSTTAGEESADTPSKAAPAAPAGTILLQVGAYSDRASAEAGWKSLTGQTDALNGVKYQIVQGEADIGTVYRLQAVPGDMAAARRLRDALEADGIASQIKQ